MKKDDRYIKFLLIEDNPGDALLVEEFLVEVFESAELVHETTFREAKKHLNGKNSFDAILLDLSLPDSNGINLVEGMIDAAGQIPVIVLTGYSNLEFSMESLAKGVSDYLLKEDLSATLLYKSIVYSIERNIFSGKLRESEKNYRELFDLSPQPMYVFDLDTYQFLDVNRSMVNHYGYSKEELLSETLRLIRPPEEIPVMKAKIEEIGNHENEIDAGVFIHQKKNGEVIHVQITTTTIDYNGKTARIVITDDVTEKLKEEKRLKLLKSVVTHTTESVVIVESEPTGKQGRRILFVNNAFCNMTGYSKKEALGKSLHILNGCETDPNELIRIRKAMNNWEICSVEFINYKKDGTPFWISTSMVPVQDNEGIYTHWVVIGRDITEHKRSEERLLKSESRLQGIIDSQTNYIIRTDLEGRYTYYNPKFKEEYGWIHNDKDLDGLHCMSSIKEYHHDRVRGTVDQCIKNPNKVYQVEIDKPGKNKMVKTTLWDFVCLTDGSGNPNEIQCVGIDITEKKANEDKLKASLKEKEILLAEIHHRVKNNLAVVSGLMQIQAFDEKNKEVEEKLLDSVFRIRTMASIHELLYESDSFSEVNFSIMLKKLLEDIASAMNADKDISLEINDHPVQLNINQAVPCALMINEVLTNAFKHAFCGRDKGKVSININETGNSVKVMVRDDGVGMDDEVMQNKDSLGVHLIKILTQQIHGDFQYIGDENGTKFIIKFQKNDIKGSANSL